MLEYMVRLVAGNCNVQAPYLSPGFSDCRRQGSSARLVVLKPTKRYTKLKSLLMNHLSRKNERNSYLRMIYPSIHIIEVFIPLTPFKQWEIE